MLNDGLQALELAIKLDIAEQKLKEARDAYTLLLGYTRSLEHRIKEMERNVRP